MNLRYIYFSAQRKAYEKDFHEVFDYNVSFIRNWLSRRIRQFKIPTDGSYKMLSVVLHPTDSSTKLLVCDQVLKTHVCFPNSELDNYYSIKDKTVLFEKYLYLLETGYRQASEIKYVPIKELLCIHQEFRGLGYRNEWNLKKMQLREYGIKISFDCTLTMDAFSLYLTVFDMKGNQLARECILKTFPDEIFYAKDIRKLTREDDKLIIHDFLDHPVLEVEVAGLNEGIIKYRMLDKQFEQYLAKNNIVQMNKLAWI